jgi:hypothetical protein
LAYDHQTLSNDYQFTDDVGVSSNPCRRNPATNPAIRRPLPLDRVVQ